MPLYLHAIKRILRELRTEQQASNESFNYAKFKKQVIATKMTEAQLVPHSALGYLGKFYASVTNSS